MSLVRFGDMVPGQNDMGSGGMGLEQIAKMTVIMLFCSTDVHCENIEKWLWCILMQKLPVRAHFQVTSIYCLLGLALISMGISLASEQVFGDFYLYLVYLCI